MQLLSSRRSVRAFLSFVAALAGADTAVAEPQRASGSTLSGSIWALTDYVDRGVSQSDGHGATQAELLWQSTSGVYASLWGSSVDLNDGNEATVEINTVVGLALELGNSLLGANVAYIHYPGAAAELEYDLVEFSATVERPAGPLELSGEAIFTPQGAGRAGKALYVALGASRPLTRTMVIGVHAGRQWHEREEIAGPTYYDWGVALEWSSGPLSARLKFSDTNRGEECVEICDARIAAGVGFAF